MTREKKVKSRITHRGENWQLNEKKKEKEERKKERNVECQPEAQTEEWEEINSVMFIKVKTKIEEKQTRKYNV